MKHVLFIVTSTNVTGAGKHPAGYEFSEVADPYEVFTVNGFTVDFASPKGGIAPYVGYDESKKTSKEFINGPGFKRLNFSHPLEHINPHAYDAIFFPGGLGPMNDLVDDPLLKTMIKDVFESGKVIGAVCHGPVALLNVQLSNGKYLVSGRHVNSFTELEEEEDGHTLGLVIPFLLDEALMEQGGIFSCAAPFKAHVVRDGNLITGQNPASATGVAEEMIVAMQTLAD